MDKSIEDMDEDIAKAKQALAPSASLPDAHGIINSVEQPNKSAKRPSLATPTSVAVDKVTSSVGERIGHVNQADAKDTQDRRERRMSFGGEGVS